MFEKREILPTFDVHGDRVLFLNLVTYLKVHVTHKGWNFKDDWMEFFVSFRAFRISCTHKLAQSCALSSSKPL